jgi:lysophospholipid acyltransferase (LPLAT)-like uncharacterized protein
MMKKLRRELVILLLPFISLLLRLWARTIRWQNRYDFEKDKGKIYALWHRYALAFGFFWLRQGYSGPG